MVVHVFVGEDALGEQRSIVIACCHAVPSLSCLLEVAQILITDSERVAIVGQRSQVRTAPSACTVQIAICLRLMIGSVEHPVVGQHACGEVESYVVGVVSAVAHVHFQGRLDRGCRQSQRDGSSEGTIAIGGGADTPLYLGRAHERGIRVHVGPKHTLVFGRVERHSVYRHIDTAVGCTADTQMGGTRTHAILAPCHHAGGVGKQEGELTPCLGESSQLLFPDVGHGKRRVLLRAYAFHHHILQIHYAQRVGRQSLGAKHAHACCHQAYNLSHSP